ncbi:MAG: hypothetical protein AAB846_02045 [Patescibacteria group bacterium]|mgnify:CR=1 FL=1
MKFEVKLKPNTRLHSRGHVLAEDLSKAMGEPTRFAAYLGIARLYYEEDLRALMRRVMEKADLSYENRGKYFFAATKGLQRKPGVTSPKAIKPTSKKAKRGREKRKSAGISLKNGKTSYFPRTK